MEDKKVIEMSQSIKAYMNSNNIAEAKPKDLMSWLIRQGDFSKDHRNGLPLRDVLRDLDKQNKLHLMPNLRVERKIKNRYWTFVK